MAPTENCDGLVIGAGPAGLMAAESMARAGRRVIVCRRQTFARAQISYGGQIGAEPAERRAVARPDRNLCRGRRHGLHPCCDAFGPGPHPWLGPKGLGQPLFTGSSGRIFPRSMKASPLLRAWLAPLDTLGVIHDAATGAGSVTSSTFATPDGARTAVPRSVSVLAHGRRKLAKRLGSDGGWRDLLAVARDRLRSVPACEYGLFGHLVTTIWCRIFRPTHQGRAPLCLVGLSLRAEFVLSARGVEGGGIYALSRYLREGAALYARPVPRSRHRHARHPPCPTPRQGTPAPTACAKRLA